MQLKYLRTRIECPPTRARLTWTSPIQVRLDYSVGKIGGIIVRVLNAKVEDDVFSMLKKKILQTKMIIPPLQFAVIEGQFTVCKVMVKFIKDLSPRDNNGFTPLHYAAQNGHLKICKLLVEKSKDPNPRCNLWTKSTAQSCRGRSV